YAANRSTRYSPEAVASPTCHRRAARQRQRSCSRREHGPHPKAIQTTTSIACAEIPSPNSRPERLRVLHRSSPRTALCCSCRRERSRSRTPKPESDIDTKEMCDRPSYEPLWRRHLTQVFSEESAKAKIGSRQ